MTRPARPSVLLATIVAAAIVVGALTASGASAVVGAAPVAARDYPFIVALVEPGWSATESQFCGGTLLVPTIMGWVQVGVVAWGDRGCGLPGSPGIDTRVAAAADWISATVGSAG